MKCCKSNEAVIDTNKATPPEQAPANDASYGNFLEPKSPPGNQDDADNKSKDGIDVVPSPQSKNPVRVVQSPPGAIKTMSSDDDDITELYVEPPKVPKNSFVYLPNVPQRGYEPEGYVSYGTTKDTSSWKKENPYRIGALVWYRNTATPPGDDDSGSFRKFKWYIPGVIEDYVWDTKDKNEVVGYKIGIEESAKPSMDQFYLDLLNNANPVDVMLRWDETTPPCPVKGIDQSLSAIDSEQRLKELVEEYGEDLGFQGAKQSGLGPHMWGITVEQLREVTFDKKYDNSMSMYDVVRNIIKPKTKGTGLGYALLLNKEKPLRAKYMVSHAWGENYNQFLSALQESKFEGPFWVCAMSICQNNDVEEVTIEKQLGPDPKYGPFATVLKQADYMVAIMTQSCDIYTRLWCVYEIYIAISMNVPVSLQSYNEITGYGGSDKMYSNVVLDSTGTPVETMNASCGYEEDTNMITEEISKEGGFGLIDDVVMWVRIKSLIDDMGRCERLMWEETQVPVPIGTCSASNITSRQNAGIANALRVWQEAKIARKKANDDGETDSEDGGESLSSLGYLSSFIRDKLCSGSSFF